jgi:hypothetical protein
MTSPKYTRGAGASSLSAPKGSTLSIPGAYKGNDAMFMKSKIVPSTVAPGLSNGKGRYMPDSVRNAVLNNNSGSKNLSALKLKPLQNGRLGSGSKTQRNSISPGRQVMDSLGGNSGYFGATLPTKTGRNFN